MLFIQHFRLIKRCPLNDLEVGNSLSVIYMTVLSLELASINLDNSNEPKIIKIGKLEADIFDILSLGSRPIALCRKIGFSGFSSYVATDSLGCIRFIKLL